MGNESSASFRISWKMIQGVRIERRGRKSRDGFALI
jgi:hypothetical protein